MSQHRLANEKRARAIAEAVPQVAGLVLHLDGCRDDDMRTVLAELLLQRLGRFGLDFRSDVWAAIDGYIAGLSRAERRALLAVGKQAKSSKLHPHDAAVRMWGIPARGTSAWQANLGI